jgi:hypothetical protein
LKEVDRGQCYSLGWMSSGAAEFCILISPCKRIDGSKKKKFTIFNKQNQDPEGSLPSLIVLKYFSAGSVDIVCSGGPNDVEELFGGSSLICITSPSKASAGDLKDQKRAVSQIEAEAMNSQQVGDDKAPVGADIPQHVRFVSQFYYLHVHKAAVQEHEDSSGAQASFSNATLEPIGPLMSRVSDVAWDTLKTTKSALSQSQFVAVLVGEKINILLWSRVYSTDDKTTGSLSHISTVELPCTSLSTSINLCWWSDVLFACSGHVVYALAVRDTAGYCCAIVHA